MRADLQAAKAASDEKRAKELEQEGEWSQVRAHQLVFSNGPVGEDSGQSERPASGHRRAARVTLMVSKWEVQFRAPNVELVDVTLPVVTLFHPSAQTLNFVNQMKAQEPIAFSQAAAGPEHVTCGAAGKSVERASAIAGGSDNSARSSSI